MFINLGIDLMNATVEEKARLDQFAARLKQLRMQKGLKQKDFAELINVHPVQYNRYEGADVLPSIEILSKIAEALGVTVDFLLEGKNEEAAVARFEDRELLEIFSEIEKFPAKKKEALKIVLASLVQGDRHEKVSARAS